MISVACRRTMTSWSPTAGEVVLFEAGEIYQAERTGDGWSARDRQGRAQLLGPDQFQSWFSETTPEAPESAAPPEEGRTAPSEAATPEESVAPSEEPAAAPEEPGVALKEGPDPDSSEHLLAEYQGALAQAIQAGERYVRAGLEQAVRTHAQAFLSPELASATLQYSAGEVAFLLLVDRQGQEIRLNTQGDSPFNQALQPLIAVAQDLRLEHVAW